MFVNSVFKFEIYFVVFCHTVDAIRNLTIHGATDVEVGTKNRYEIVCNAR